MTDLEQKLMEMVSGTLRDIEETLENMTGILALTVKPACVWVFTAEQAYEGLVYDTIVKTFATEQAAQEFMQSFIHEDGDETIEELVEKKGWVKEFDTAILYRASRNGHYEQDHVELTITKCEIQK